MTMLAAINLSEKHTKLLCEAEQRFIRDLSKPASHYEDMVEVVEGALREDEQHAN